jgi:hypothetical protein
MSKLITVALLVGGLIAGAAGVSSAQIQGGIGDPLTLAASGVVVPFFFGGNLGGVATLQVASPVGDNLQAHMFFYNATCQRVGLSTGLPLTTNDIGFVQVSNFISPLSDGLVAFAQANQSGFGLIPLANPVHARLYQFANSDGRSRVIEPIIINTAEFPSVAHWWSPLRTGATFYAPLETVTVKTDLYLICPRATIVGNGVTEPAAFGNDTGGGVGDLVFTTTGFPQINPRLPNGVSQLGLRIYDDNEFLRVDTTITCDCVTKFESIILIAGGIYGNGSFFPNGTYSELSSFPPSNTINPSPRTSFTGYTSSFTTNVVQNAFFGRLSNGSQLSLQGPAAVTER